MSQHIKPTIRFVQPAKTEDRSSAQSDQSSLIVYAFYSLWAIQRGINEKHCHTGWMYSLNESYCRLCHPLFQQGHSISYKIMCTQQRLRSACASYCRFCCALFLPGHSISCKITCTQQRFRSACVSYYRFFCALFELGHSISYKITCPAKTQISLCLLL